MITFPLTFDCDLNIPFKFDFDNTNQGFNLGFELSIETSEIANYEGSYEIVPKVHDQIVETKNKYLKEDLTVVAIPYYDVSNTVGGTTVYIADIVEVI